RMTLAARLNHVRALENQLPIAKLRVVYAASGTLPAAVIVEDTRAIVEHGIYWAAIPNPTEARFLAAILNSEAVRVRVAPLQPKGQGGARHFDKLVWELRIPRFDSGIALHRALAAAGAEAERLAAAVPLTNGAYFTHRRRAIRGALRQSGIADKIDGLVGRLVPAP
ncbi:MAG: hypothetical protein ACREFZ_12420, partial [Acetobacteraceae bacterium]